jgi:immune inhibitor A
VTAGQTRLVTLGPEEYNSDKKQAIVVTLPKKTVTTDLGAPAGGTKQWYSGDGSDLDNSMAKSGIAIPAGTTTLSLKARWDIEQCGPDACDYAFVEVNDGTGFAAIPGSITVAAEGNGIDGTQATYTPATFDLSAYAGKTISLRFRYVTDGAVAGNDDAVPNGIFIDDVAITNGATTILSDGAETSPNGWTLAGFSSVGPSTSQQFDNFYIAGHRSYVGFDQYLKTGPYYFGYANTRPDFVDHYSYQTGLLISYWDTSYEDNDTFAHPGNGRNLYIDSHPTPLARSDGALWRSRVQVYDAPFGLSRTDKVTLHQNSAVETIQGRAGQPLFDDQGTYWFASLPNHGVKLPAVGVKIRVLLTVGTSMLVLVS